MGGQMVFFQQLIADLEHSPPEQQHALSRGGAAHEVLKYAPRKVRNQHRILQERINELEAEMAQWRDRACCAETRLRFFEKSIQQIVAEHLPGFRFRG